MPVYAELHDGRRLEFPDGTDPAVVQATVKKLIGSPEPIPKERALGMLPEPVRGVADYLVQHQMNRAGGLLRGAGSIGSTLLTGMDYLTNKPTLSTLVTGETPMTRDKERRAAMDDALGRMGANTGSTEFGVNKLASEVAGTSGIGGVAANTLSRVPGVATKAAPLIEALRTSGMSSAGQSGVKGLLARMAGGGATGYASAGLVNPEDANTGGMIGAALPPAAKVAGEGGKLIGGMFRPAKESADLARKAVQDYGIPLTPADLSGNALVRGARSALDDLPVIGRMGARAKDGVQQGFNKAVGATFGAPEASLTPEVMDKASGAIKKELNRIWEGSALQLDAQLLDDIGRVESKAAEKLNPEQAAQVSRQIQSLLSKAQDAKVSGGFANNWQSELRMVADSEKGLHQRLLGDLRKAVISAFNRSVGPEEAQALAKARGQYKAIKTVEPLLQGAEAGVAGRRVGDIPAGLLPQAVRQGYGSQIKNSPFADLSQIGSQFVADRVARTGGSARAAFQNSMLGTGLALGTQATPWALAGVPLAAGLEGLLSSPSAGRMLLGAHSSADPLFSPALYRTAPLLGIDQ